MENLIQTKLSNVNSGWSKDLIIRYLYKELAPYFRRDLKYFLASKEEQIEMYKQGFEYTGPEIVCKSLCDFYEDIFKDFDIRANVITATNDEVPLFSLIVEGDNNWYYLNPLRDLFANQYGIFPDSFGNMKSRYEQFILKQYPFVQDLPREYVDELDGELGITHVNEFLEDLSQNMKINNRYRTMVPLDKSATKLEIIESKLEYGNQNLINIGNVNGLIERKYVYDYLFFVMFDKSEKPRVRTKIFNDQDQWGLSVLVTSDDQVTVYKETKLDQTGYCLRKVKDNSLYHNQKLI